MKKLVLLTILISFSVYSQELDETFLKTLPKEMQDDILKKTNQSNEDPVYRSIENKTKLEKKSLEDLKKRLELDLEYLKDKLAENSDNENTDKSIAIPFNGNHLFFINDLWFLLLFKLSIFTRL